MTFLGDIDVIYVLIEEGGREGGRERKRERERDRETETETETEKQAAASFGHLWSL